MPEQAIIRTQVIVVGEVGTNTYGDLTFTDKEGGAYKIGAKRKQYFEKVIIPSSAVQLSYAMSSFGKEYIYTAISVATNLPLPTTPLPMTHPTAPAMTERPNKILSKEELRQAHPSSSETGMWWNQLGEMLRAGDIDKTTVQGKAMRTAYYAEMIRVLGINVKEVQPANKLIEAAMKLGAVEIPVEEGE